MQDGGSQRAVESADNCDGWDSLVNDTRADQSAPDNLAEQAPLGDDPVPNPAGDGHGQHAVNDLPAALAAEGPLAVRTFSAVMPQSVAMQPITLQCI